jgi:ribosomal protein S14
MEAAFLRDGRCVSGWRNGCKYAKGLCPSRMTIRCSTTSRPQHVLVKSVKLSRKQLRQSGKVKNFLKEAKLADPLPFAIDSRQLSRGNFPIDALVHDVEQRNRLKSILPWLKARPSLRLLGSSAKLILRTQVR